MNQSAANNLLYAAEQCLIERDVLIISMAQNKLQKDTGKKGEQKVISPERKIESGKTGQVGVTTQSDKKGAKDGGETSENAGT